MPQVITWWRTWCSGCRRELLWQADQYVHKCAWCGQPAARAPGAGEQIPVHQA